jgi:hypothetical protein
LFTRFTAEYNSAKRIRVQDDDAAADADGCRAFSQQEIAACEAHALGPVPDPAVVVRSASIVTLDELSTLQGEGGASVRVFGTLTRVGGATSITPGRRLPAF